MNLKEDNIILFVFYNHNSHVVKGKKQRRGEGLCGPRAPAPGDFISWTSVAEVAWLGRSDWFPLLHGGTWKLGFVPLCFWPGGEAANPDALHPGKAKE